MQSANNVTNNCILLSFPADVMERLWPQLKVVDLPQRYTIYETDKKIDYVHFIESGVASILALMSDGSMIEAGMTGFEGLVGLPAVHEGPISRQTIVQQIPGAALRLSAEAFKAEFDASAIVRDVTLRFMDEFLNTSAQTAACNRLHYVNKRAARWLLMSSDRVRSEYLPLTQDYLASMLGVRRQGVAEAAAELQRSGLIQYRQGKITIMDREGLESISCECYRSDKQRFQRTTSKVDRAS